MTNVINAFLAGRQVRQDEQRNALAMQDRQRAIGQENSFMKAQNALAGGDRDAARQMAAGSGPQGYAAIQQQIAGLDDQQAAQTEAAADALGEVAYTAMNLPYEHRGGFIMQQSPRLAQFGVTQEMLSRFDPTDENLQARAMEVDDIRSELLRRNRPAQPTSDMRNFQHAQENPGFAQYQHANRRAGATNVTVDTGEREEHFAGATAERNAGVYNSILDAGDAASTNARNLDILADTLLSPDVYTGAGAEVSLPARRAIRSMTGGELDIGNVASTEVARAVSTELALALKDELPGPMSDGDREFLQSIPPNIGNTREGNAALIFLSRRRANYEMQQSVRLNEFMGNDPSEARFRQWMNQEAGQTAQQPMFTEDDRRGVDLLLNGAEFRREGNRLIVRDGNEGILLEF